MNYSEIGIKLVLLGVLCGLLLFSACKCDTCEEKTYVIANDTNHKVELRMFLSRQIRNSHMLERIGASAVIVCKDDLWCTPQIGWRSDSVAIIFDDSLYWPHRVNPPPNIPIVGNVLVEGNYNEIRTDYFVYSITESDYELAVPFPE